MEIQIHLHGSLRDLVAPDQKGRTTIVVRDSATIQDVQTHLGINHPVAFAVNDEVEVEGDYILKAGDKVDIFSIIGGGSR